MPATPIAASDRFFHRGKTKVYAVTTIANILSPTRGELNAGADLSVEVADWSGWTITSGEIETPVLSSVFTSKIGGSLDIEESSITLYADKEGTDVRSLLPRDTNTHIVILDGGDVAGNKMDVFKVRVRSVGKGRSLGDEAGTVIVSFSVTAEPAENVTVPA